MKHKTTLEIWRDNEYRKIRLYRLKGKIILDVGCGQGDVAYFLSSIADKVVGIDVQEKDEWSKYKAKNLRFIKGDAEKMPFKTASFNAIFLQDVLHHVSHPEKVLREIDRVTKKNSIIFIIEANRYNPLFYFHMTKMRGHEHFTEKQFKSYILEVFKTASFTSHESHFIPFVSAAMCLRIGKFIEQVFEFPILRNYKAYNFAVIKK